MELSIPYSVANIFWKCGPIKLCPAVHPAPDLVEWFYDMIDLLHGEHLEFFLLSLWAIWNERNNLVWKGRCFIPMNVVKWMCTYLDEYKKLHARGAKNGRHVTKWKCPPSGRLKVNIDGSFRAGNGCGGELLSRMNMEIA
ncbi:hypothetical protein RchiOBHm_Chr1g0316081 [Rosa chinensis]|uniref:Uncharacterized protein n=1 Tax=Rosa chinensis TaxID=74649 RepID=A0A2P6S7N8_ROSCH|nr:hypothetical protein RchiOBHm_Chr1g0316081 [Rosa chinensis]